MMGTDNQGYFVVGNHFDDINFSNFPRFDEIGQDEDVSDFYYFNNVLPELRLKWELKEPVGYQRSDVFGFCLSSPSYGRSDYNLIDFASDLGVIQRTWREWARERPNVFLLNVQG